MSTIIDFKLKEFIYSIKHYPDCRFSILCYGKKQEMFVFEVEKSINSIIVHLSDIEEKLLYNARFYIDSFESNIESHKTIDIEKRIQSYINRYNTKFYKFISPDKICRSTDELEKIFSNQKSWNITDVKIIKDEQTGFKIIEAFGLIFKRFFYRQKYSDFGDDNYVYEISANSRFSSMYDKPVLFIEINPSGNWEQTLYNIKHHRLGGRTLDLSRLFYDDKNLICINFDEVPNSYSLQKRKTINFNEKAFKPIINRNCYILTEMNWTTSKQYEDS